MGAGAAPGEIRIGVIVATSRGGGLWECHRTDQADTAPVRWRTVGDEATVRASLERMARGLRLRTMKPADVRAEGRAEHGR